MQARINKLENMMDSLQGKENFKNITENSDKTSRSHGGPPSGSLSTAATSRSTTGAANSSKGLSSRPRFSHSW